MFDGSCSFEQLVHRCARDIPNGGLRTEVVS
jgi:hypothetical protein